MGVKLVLNVFILENRLNSVPSKRSQYRNVDDSAGIRFALV